MYAISDVADGRVVVVVLASSTEAMTEAMCAPSRIAASLDPSSIAPLHCWLDPGMLKELYRQAAHILEPGSVCAKDLYSDQTHP